AVIVGGIAAVLPVPIYAFLIISLDRYEKEPSWLLVGAFFWGAIVASFFSLVLNTVMAAVFAILLGPEWAQILTPAFVAPFVEAARETRCPILKWIAPGLGYFAEMFLHFLWNTASLVIGASMAGHPVVHLLIVLPFQWFFLILPGLITLLAIAFFAWRREARV